MTTINNRLSNNYKKNNKDLLNKEYPYFLNPFKFDINNIKILSAPGDTTSGSCVFLVKRKDEKKYQYILKVTGITNNDMNFPDISYPKLESKLYKVMNRLVRRKITPHVFISVSEIPDINRDLLNSNNKFKFSFLDIFEYNYCYAMLNETTVKNTDIITFSDFLYKYSNNFSLFVNILFQIIYTLESFNRIGVIHSDLQMKKVFIIINKNNILSNNYKKSINIYKFKDSNNNQHIVKLENMGFQVRIYDFDRSLKFPKKGTIFPDIIRSEITKSLDKFSCYHTKENPYFDTYKIIAHLYNHYEFDKSIVKQIQYMLESFFIKKELLISGVVNKVDYISNYNSNMFLKRGDTDNFDQWRNYFFLNRIPHGLMLTSEEILIKMKNEYSKQLRTCNKPIIEEFNLENIKSTKKSTRKNTKKGIIK